MDENEKKAAQQRARSIARDAINELTALLRNCQPEHIISRVALYICSGTPDTIEREEADRNETHLEYLISLATAFPYPADARFPTPDDIQNAINLLTKIHQAASAYHLFASLRAEEANKSLSEIAHSFRMDRLHVRGDAFWPHLRKTISDLLAPHDRHLKTTLGFASSDFFGLFDRAEKLLNERFQIEHREMCAPYTTLLRPWRAAMALPDDSLSEEAVRFHKFCEENADAISKARRSFDEFGTPNLFAITPETSEEKAVISALSCTFGDDSEFHGLKPDHAFWPLTASLTERKPIIRHGGSLFAFHLPKIQREAYDIISRMLRASAPDYWESQFLSARDTYLEREVAVLFRQALPSATIITGAIYPFGKSNAETEADIVVVCDDFLLVIECKAGSIAAATKRGGARSAESDLRETIIGAHNQAERLVLELERRRTIALRSKHDNAKHSISFDDFRYVARISVTLELMNAASTSLLMLEDSGKLHSAEKCWAVALNDLRVVVDILDSPATFLHFITRRLDLNAIRQVNARDELDYLMHYVERGLSFREQNAQGDSEEIAIVHCTQDLEQYYRRMAGLSQFGKKPKPKIPKKLLRFMEFLATSRPQHYISACLTLLDFDKPDQLQLLAKPLEHLALIRRDRTVAYGFSLCANPEFKSGIALATAIQPHLVREAILGRAISHCQRYSLNELCVIVQSIPLGKLPPVIFIARPNDSVSQQGTHLLEQLRFEAKEKWKGSRQ